MRSLISEWEEIASLEGMLRHYHHPGMLGTNPHLLVQAVERRTHG
jgi:hypothetical protein